MRVAIVVEKVRPGNGGAEIGVLELALGLQREGIDVEFFARQSRHATYSDFPVTARNRCRLWLDRHKGFVTWVDHTIMGRSNRIDIVHAITPVLSADVYQPRSGIIDATYRHSIRKYLSRRKPICGVGRPNSRQKEKREQERLLAKKTGCIFTPNSRFVQSTCTEYLGIPPERNRLIYNGIDINSLVFARNRNQEAEKLREKLQGTVHDDYLLGLFPVTSNLLLKGTGPLEEAIRILREQNSALAQRLRIMVATRKDNYRGSPDVQEHFVNIGPQNTRSQMAACYDLVDFVILPSWHDPCSRVVLEGICLGTPAITSKFNGAGEVVSRYNCGIVANLLARKSGCFCAEDLAKAIEKMADPVQRETWKINCANASEYFCIDHHVKGLICIYEEILRSRNRVH